MMWWHYQRLCLKPNTVHTVNFLLVQPSGLNQKNKTKKNWTACEESLYYQSNVSTAISKLSYCVLAPPEPICQPLSESVDQQMFFRHAPSTEAGCSDHFCWTRCHTHRLNFVRLLLNQLIPPDIQPVCTGLKHSDFIMVNNCPIFRQIKPILMVYK